MENTSLSQKKSLWSNRWFQIVIVIAGVALLILGLTKLLSPGSTVSDKFIDKFNELITVSQEVGGQMTDIGKNIQEVWNKESAGDYTGALKMVDDFIAQTDNIANKANLMADRVIEFKKLAEAVKDQAAKTSSLKVADNLDQLQGLMTKELATLKQLLLFSQEYYSDILAQKRENILSETESETLTELVKTMTTDQQKVQELVNDFQTNRLEMEKAAGLERTPSE
ncbi:hypothetical protein A2108_00440 [Candidatus Wolfebacteria bacterium GWA1_42_9]|uniref:Uncharacterized protein n=1 Tax=Candidatus Wolfebacteria bacterium GWA1_42_9 TaxID=1802553 RepID=A0A1F8DQ62_9BACT|nr:MAG: hypothetical protein UW08_C0005G0042 [Parcubacteria group bacterium GW2011_GWB1_43_8b]OGM90099.1 MAG: hypothetical protein A2108_00440 [Candidatus Wolfebacteria bacterium GWA1_42_9]